MREMDIICPEYRRYNASSDRVSIGDALSQRRSSSSGIAYVL